ncbi:DUF1573 domain-containing protein [Stieleria varia]|uniref:DUF1573 domain-containing protein n=1 Tax=Stieleria varia TaxID=2528005 RepID=UPI00313EF079
MSERQRVPLGTLASSSTNPVSIELRNPTTEPITLLEATVSCGCMAVSTTNAKIDPGKTCRFSLSIKTGPMSGPNEKSVILHCRTSSGEKIAKRIEFTFLVTNRFELYMPIRRLTVDPNERSEKYLDFVLRGFRGFDLSRVSLTVSGVEGEVTRTPMGPSGEASSAEHCRVALKNDVIVDRPLQMVLVAREDGDPADSHSITERVVVLKKEQVSISPQSPRVVNGRIVLIARLLTPPTDSPLFELM